jgi:hypothetical protein
MHSILKIPVNLFGKGYLESAAASDSVLLLEKKLSKQFKSDQQFAFEERNGIIIRQYSSQYCIAYNALLNGMIERRMRQSIFAIASFWHTRLDKCRAAPIYNQSVSKNLATLIILN